MGIFSSKPGFAVDDKMQSAIDLAELTAGEQKKLWKIFRNVDHDKRY